MGTGVRTEAFGMVFDSFAECCRYFGEEPRKIREYMKSNNIDIEQALDTYRDSLKVTAFDTQFKNIQECCSHYKVETVSVKSYMSRFGLSIEQAIERAVLAREQREKDAEERNRKEADKLQKIASQSFNRIVKNLGIKSEITLDTLLKQKRDLKCIYVYTCNDNILNRLDKCVIVIGAHKYLIDKKDLLQAINKKCITFVNVTVKNEILTITEHIELDMLDFIKNTIGCNTFYAAYMNYINDRLEFNNMYTKYINGLSIEFYSKGMENMGHKSSLGTSQSLNSQGRLNYINRKF